MKKKTYWIGFFLFFLILAGTMQIKTVHAASYKTIDVYQKKEKVENVTFSYTYGTSNCLYVTKNGKTTLLAKAEGLSSTLVTNGKNVYYSINKSVYYTNVNGKSKKKLFSVTSSKSKWNPVTLRGYYKNKLYYTDLSAFETSEFCSYNLKSRKKTALVKNKDMPGAKSATQDKQYFFLTTARGDFGPVPLLLYNASNGKKCTITKKLYPDYYIKTNKKIHYAELVYANGQYSEIFNVSVKSCNLSGNSRKTLVRNFKAKRIIKFTKNSITYLDANGKQKIKRF